MDKKAERVGQKNYEYVFHFFADRIRSGEFRLNEKIPTEREIAQQLQISRNSVREALHVMEMMGLIECLQGSGNYVRCEPQACMFQTVNLMMVLQKISYTELLQMRQLYENGALQLAMEAITPQELQAIHEILLEMDRPMSIQASSQLDVALHTALVRASHNRLLIFHTELMQELLDQFIQKLRTSILADKHRAAALHKSHWDIYYALQNKKLEAGLQALNRHFDIVSAHLAAAIRQKEASGETPQR